MTTPTRLSPVGLLSPVTPSSPPSEMSAPLSSLATSVPSMLTSPSGEEERPLLFRTPPILRDKSASTQGRKSGHNLRNSAHYNHGLDIPSPPPSPLHIEEEIDCLEQYKSTSVPSSAPHSPSAARTQPSGQAAPEQAVTATNRLLRRLVAVTQRAAAQRARPRMNGWARTRRFWAYRTLWPLVRLFWTG